LDIRISTRALLSMAEAVSLPFDIDGAIEDLSHSEAEDFVVRMVSVREVLSIWQMRAERAHENGEFAVDMDQLVDRALLGDLDVVAEVFLESGEHGSMF
jgi:hypothetical protein